MDEKTAAIPSLKDFKEKQKERSAQAERTGSMQTKGQMRRNSTQNSRTSSAQRSSRPSSTSSANRGGTPQRPASQKNTSAQNPQSRNAQRRTSASAPRQTASQGNAVRSRTSERAQRNAQSQKREYRGAAEERRSASSCAQDRRTSSSSQRKRPSARPAVSQRKPSENSPKPTVKKAKKPLSPRMRKFRNFLIYMLIVFIVIVVGGILSLTVLFKTDNINVNGLEGVYQKQEIVSASGLNLGENIFTAPKSRAESRLEKKYPYIEKADIYSVFPDSINIDITIATPACVVEGLGGYYIVSDKGKVLEVSATDDEAGVPIIEGVQVAGAAAGEFVEYGSEEIRMALEEIFAAFKEYDCKKITAINIKAEDDTFSVKYVYDNRIVVYLGIPENINYKIQTAAVIIKDKIDIGGTMIAGDLDVSMCHDTMKAYFNQYSLLAPQISPTVPAETETEPEQ